MTPSFNHRLILLCILILSAEFIAGQIITRPDSNLSIDRSKSMLALMPCKNGAFYLNDFYLMNVSKNDTVFISDVEARNYTVRFTVDSVSCHRNLAVNNRKLYTIWLCDDSISISEGNKFELYERANRIHGKKIYYGQKACFYNDTHVALYSFETETSKDGAFNSWTTINGYIIVPGFCIGLGVAYHHLSDQYLGSYYDKNYHYEYVYRDVSYIPVFLDIRSYFSPGKVTPFLKLDVGHNFLLSGKDESDYEYSYKGKVLLSPGIGLKIYCSDLVQVSTAFEYSYEQFTVQHNKSAHNISNNFLKFTLGIGFQKKL